MTKKRFEFQKKHHNAPRFEFHGIQVSLDFYSGAQRSLNDHECNFTITHDGVSTIYKLFVPHKEIAPVHRHGGDRAVCEWLADKVVHEEKRIIFLRTWKEVDE